MSADLPVWPFEPNWSSTVTESLEWLTDILASPTGAEQRIAMRWHPRRSFEFDTALVGNERSLFDNLLSAYGTDEWVLPLWYEVNFTSAPVVGQSIPIDGLDLTEIRAGSFVVLMGETPFDIEVAEVASVTGTQVNVTAALDRSWPVDTRVYPATVARLAAQPQVSRRSSDVVTSRITFSESRAVPLDLTMFPPSFDSYLSEPVLYLEPQWRDQMNLSYERLDVSIDNNTSVPQFADTAKREFVLQDCVWNLDGRHEHFTFKAMFHYLRGRALPIWLPSYMDDFTLAATAPAGAGSITVERSGFVLAGGPSPRREHILIQTETSRQYRRIIGASEVAGGREILLLNSPLSRQVTTANIVRISFITLSRLNHDAVEIVHSTDTDGASAIRGIFRAAPELRQVETEA